MHRYVGRMALCAGLVPIAGASLAAQGRSDSLPEGVSAAMVAKGKTLFESSGLCFACHGMDGAGTVGANLTDSVWVHHDGSYVALVRQITLGISDRDSKSGTPMPPRGGSGLKDEEIRAVAAYVWTLSRRPPKP